MTWTEFMHYLAHLFEETFKVLPMLGNTFNYLLLALGFVLIFFWLKKQSDYNKQAEREGTLK